MKKCAECGEQTFAPEFESIWNGTEYLEVCDLCRITGEGQNEVWFCWEHGEYFFSFAECPEIKRKKEREIFPQ